MPISENNSGLGKATFFVWMVCLQLTNIAAPTASAFTIPFRVSHRLAGSVSHHHEAPAPHYLSHRQCVSRNWLFLSSEGTASSADNEVKNWTVRVRLRQATGFSLTAIRATLRTATGVSLTTVYAGTVAATGAWIRQSMRLVLSIFPAWMRYFVQPFLILYYVPLFILRNLTGPTRKRALASHELVLAGWKRAIEEANRTTADWPVHLNPDGYIEKESADVDLNKAVADSVELSVNDEKN
jgi:hypothetical protein